MSDLRLPVRTVIRPATIVELTKPVTWFAPAWAFACGAVAAGPSPAGWATIAAGMLLAGPLVCGTSQVVNDWYDRHVDAINQPERPIPSGRAPGQSALWVAAAGAALSLLLAARLGPAVLAAAVAALLIGWAYSAPPLRLKRDGWAGAAASAFSYEGLSWVTGALVAGGGAALGRPMLVACAVAYSIGAHGIMTLNDFKAVAGDRATGIASLPVRLGVRRAGIVACAIMLAPQIVVAALIAAHGMLWRAAAIAALAAAQVALMPRLLADPERRAAWYNGTGVVLFVAGMMVAAFAIRAAA